MLICVIESVVEHVQNERAPKQELKPGIIFENTYQLGLYQHIVI